MILLTSINDIDNQSAPTITRIYDKQGARTIGILLFRRTIHVTGVLTKPDTVGEVDCDIWLKIVNNKSHILHHGYYLTRLPRDEKEMQQTPTKSREMESNYLQGHQRWGKVDKNRLGTAKLAEVLSTRLSLMIEETFNLVYNCD